MAEAMVHLRRMPVTGRPSGLRASRFIRFRTRATIVATRS
jgi:hypothetical protein